MVSQLMFHRAMRLMVSLALIAVMVCPVDSAAQTPAITADGTLATAVSQVGDAYTISGGALRGDNLFHSFGQFNVPAFGSATFSGPSSINNILSRVTGGQPSTIDGLISSRASMPNANFFLINPSGVVFTSGASLDVGGAFRASTSDNIRLADGAVFSASPVPGELAMLTSAPPQAFGFLGSAPASISVQGAVLAVDPGQTLSLVGGDVRISGGALVAPGGLVQIGSVASPGNALLSTRDLDLASFPRRGQVSISDGAFVTAGTDFILPGGTVVIRSGRLIVDNSVLLTETFDLAGAPVGLDLGATDSVVVRNGGVVRTQSFGAGDASGISIVTGSLALTDAATVESLAFSAGRTGDIDIRVGRADILNGTIRTSSVESGSGKITIAASDAVTLSGPTSEISTGTFDALGLGVLGGNIALTAGDVTLGDRARIRSGSVSEEAGESLSVNARGSLMISGLAGISSQAFSQSAGAVDISASRLILDAGYVNTSTLGAGDAGRILVTAGTLTLTNGAQIASSSEIVASGAGGSITINAASSVAITGVGPDDGVGSITFTHDPSSGILSTTSNTGNAGQIAVSTPTLTIGGAGKISVATSGAGNAGSISLNVTDFTQTGGARVDSSTISGGGGGNLILTAANSATIASPGTGLFSTASGAGAGGDINVQAKSVRVFNGGIISANSTGTATASAGTVSIVAGELLKMEDGSITTESIVADGGDIRIRTTGSLVQLTNSQIATSVQSGSGAGGNIAIGSASHPVDFLILNDSGIHANAFGGPGGNINISANTFLSSLPIASAVTASSALSSPGTIDIQATVTDVSERVVHLPDAILQAAILLRASCAARVAEGKSSSLVLAARDGLPLEPGSLLPSPLYLAADSVIGLGGHRPSKKPVASHSQLTLFESSGERVQLRREWDQFHAAKTALGFACSR